MTSSNEKDVAGAISDIVAEVFISSKMCGVCLPVSLILMEQLQKFKLNPALNCGQLTYEGKIKGGCLHVWVSADDKIIDPTLKISKVLGIKYELVSDDEDDYESIDFAKFRYHPGEETANDEGSEQIMKMYKFLRQSGNMVEEYFKMAPKRLNVIRNVINHKIEQAHLDR